MFYNRYYEKEYYKREIIKQDNHNNFVFIIIFLFVVIIAIFSLFDLLKNYDFKDMFPFNLFND